MDENVTRFVLLAQADEAPTGRDRTSIAFTLDRDRPGGLYEVLGEFARRGINLSKVESRPMKEALGHYVFFLDFERHRLEPDAAAGARRRPGARAQAVRARLVPAGTRGLIAPPASRRSGSARRDGRGELDRERAQVLRPGAAAPSREPHARRERRPERGRERRRREHGAREPRARLRDERDAQLRRRVPRRARRAPGPGKTQFTPAAAAPSASTAPEPRERVRPSRRAQAAVRAPRA